MKHDYWKWLLKGINEEPGYKCLLSKWLYLHAVIGMLLSIIVDGPISHAADSFLLPLASIFVGLSFAWAGNAQALLQTEEIEELTIYHKDGIASYVYTFQTAILIILVTTGLWGLAAVRVFDFEWTIFSFSAEVLLFMLASLTVRECWHVVLGSQYLLLIRYRIKNKKDF